MRPLLLLIVTICLLGSGGCGQDDGAPRESAAPAKAKLTIAYQYGMAYAPLLIMRDQQLIEKNYGREVTVEWKLLGSGADINAGVVSGDIDVAFMGIAPFVIGFSKGIPYRLYSGLSAQPMGLNTNKSSYRKLSDFGPDDKIALVSYGSIQHIMLAMAAEKELGAADALDKHILNMPHPDGMQALLSGSVSGHLTTSPYYNKELATAGIHTINSVAEAFPAGCTIIIGAASIRLYESNPALYQALVAATSQAIDYLNANSDEVAAMLHEREGVSREIMLSYLTDDRVRYTAVPSGVEEVAEFMKRVGLVDRQTVLEPQALFFDNALGGQ